MVFHAGELAGAAGRFRCWDCAEEVDVEGDETLAPCPCGGNDWIRLRDDPSQAA